MRLLLDECVPRPLKRDLLGHDVWTVVERGWSSKRNGELLKLMHAEGFEALLTVDQGLEFEQNLRESGIAVVLLEARTNRLKELRPLVPQILKALARVSAGDLIRVGGLTPARSRRAGPGAARLLRRREPHFSRASG